MIKYVQLQLAINTLFDSSKSLSKKEQESKGIRQIIEKKEGILRMKMMGKKVNHSGTYSNKSRSINRYRRNRNSFIYSF